MMNATVTFRYGAGSASISALQPRKQRGVVLIIALIVLVAMTLASIAMVRSVDTSSIIAGNLAFKQSGVASGDAGVEAAITWLSANSASLENDSASNGYYATSQDCLGLTGNGHLPDCSPQYAVLDWSNAGAVKTLDEDAAGNRVSYVIHRMCDSTGPVKGATCSADQNSRSEGQAQGSKNQLIGYQDINKVVISRVYYRITVRIAGPRNNTSYVQTIVSLPV